jgi:chromosome segregation ATPase
VRASADVDAHARCTELEQLLCFANESLRRLPEVEAELVRAQTELVDLR